MVQTKLGFNITSLHFVGTLNEANDIKVIQINTLDYKCISFLCKLLNEFKLLITVSLKRL